MAYVTVQQYVDRYGEAETRRLTSEFAQGDPAATYDTAKVEEALEDATEEVEGYIARRYTTPLADVPKVVAGWVAAIARFKLYGVSTRVNDNVKEAADRAYAMLKDLVAGKMNLPITEGEPLPGEISAGDPLTSRDRDPSSFGCGALDSFTAPFTRTGCGMPNWMR